MKISLDTSSLGSIGREVEAKASEMSERVNSQLLSRGARAVNEIRDQELDVLSGQRSGRSYTKSPYRSTYTASAPGEPPARRSGALRLHWNGTVKGGNGKIVLYYESTERYSTYLEEGTRRMAARPFKDKIIEQSMPKIKKIFGEPYT